MTNEVLAAKVKVEKIEEISAGYLEVLDGPCRRILNDFECIKILTYTARALCDSL